MLTEFGQTGLPVSKHLALNERDYGDLSGLNKDDARKKWGEEQVLSGGAPTTCRRPAAKA